MGSDPTKVVPVNAAARVAGVQPGSIRKAIRLARVQVLLAFVTKEGMGAKRYVSFDDLKSYYGLSEEDFPERHTVTSHTRREYLILSDCVEIEETREVAHV